jgi:hypothetical protein
MQATQIREKLHEYIDHSDEKLLKLMFALAKEYNDDEANYLFNENDIKELDELTAKRLSGESKTYNWTEAKNMITKRS